MFSPHKSFAGAYHQVHVQTGVEGADGRRLVSLLYDGALGAISAARSAMGRGDVEGKCHQVGRAIRIVDEGLLGGLDLGEGGDLAANLRDLYTYVIKRLAEANLRNDEAALGECARLLAPLRDAWDEAVMAKAKS
jgi:flagellar protein FliS